jgi:hypothetical protein
MGVFSGLASVFPVYISCILRGAFRFLIYITLLLKKNLFSTA